jgi:phosphomannomutase
VVRVMVEGMEPELVQRLAEQLAETVRAEIGA